MEISYKKGSLTAEDIQSILADCNYYQEIWWFKGLECNRKTEKCIEDNVAKELLEGGECTVRVYFEDGGENRDVKLTYKDFEKGARRMAKHNTDSFLNFVQNLYDMWDASAFMQYVIYKELVY